MTERVYNLNPIVVTGSGHHQRLKSTTTPVSVLSAVEMKEQGITTLDGALTRMMPQVSMAPSSMGSFLRLNGLSGKYILILINGQKMTGDISNNLDLNRINMSRVKLRAAHAQPLGGGGKTGHARLPRYHDLLFRFHCLLLFDILSASL